MLTAIDLPASKETRSSPVSQTFTKSSITSANALVTSLATSASPSVISGAGLNGTIGANVFTYGTYAIKTCQSVTVTTSTHTGSYNLVAITVAGLDAKGNAITDTLTLTQVNGNETLKTSKGFTQVTSITVPAMVDALGAFTFGVTDLFFAQPPRWVIATAADSVIHMKFGSLGEDLPALTKGVAMPIQPSWIDASATTTATAFTLLF